MSDLELTRRRFVALTGTAATGALATAAFGQPLPHTLIEFTTDTGYPLLLPGEAVTASRPVRVTGRFAPLFGADRAVVNPAEPEVRDRRKLVFREPGEYYLTINGASSLKAVVFAPDEGIGRSVLRLFDFFVANNLYMSAQDDLWYAGRANFLTAFFASREPMMLSCGPTHQMFREAVQARFCLPARVASGVGTFYEGGRLVARAHNVPEIWLPEAKKFVFMDLNTGYVPQWLDGSELAEATRAWGDTVRAGETIEDLGFPIHATVETRPVSDVARQVLPATGTGGKLRYHDALVRSTPFGGSGRAYWTRGFYSGVGYFGAKMRSVSGTEFLPNEYYTAMLHRDPRLNAAVAEWLRAQNIRMETLERDTLRRLLDDGHRHQLAEKQWQARFPAAKVTL